MHRILVCLGATYEKFKRNTNYALHFTLNMAAGPFGGF